MHSLAKEVAYVNDFDQGCKGIHRFCECVIGPKAGQSRPLRNLFLRAGPYLQALGRQAVEPKVQMFVDVVNEDNR